MGKLLSLVRTTPTRDEFVASMRRAWERIFPATPFSFIIAACLFAQFAFETGWGKSCWCYNVGNERTGKLNPPDAEGWAGDYVELRTADEYVMVDGVQKHVIVGGYFRAFQSLDEGCAEHLVFLDRLPQYRPALNTLLGSTMFTESDRSVVETARMVAEALKRGGYFTGPLPPYSGGMQQIALATFKAIVPEDHPHYEPWTAKFESMPWLPETEAMTALEMIFGDDWKEHDTKTIALVTACRYDCEEAA